MKKLVFVLSLNLCLLSTLFAGTFDKVVTIFNNSCAFGGCHDAETARSGLNFSADKESIYEQLINKRPSNNAAAAKNHQLVKPGDPVRSFLYRKINHNLHNDSKLTEGEKQNMPIGYALQKQEIELVRQWILFGAKNDTKEYVSVDVLEDYYTLGGLEPIAAPEPPPVGKGYQLQLGPLFLAPGEEVEYIYKYELQNEQALEIKRVDVAMNPQSHHFLFFKFDEGKENTQAEGLLPVNFLSNPAISNDTKMIGGWAYSRDFKLPEGTAFKWDENEILKLNYHLLNYSSNSILPATLYVNIYTQPVGTALMEMHSEFHLSLEDDRLVGFEFPPGQSTHQWITRNFEEASNRDPVHIWLLGSHTHKYGVDFDMYRYNNNTIGNQVYEGFHNFDHTIPTDFYDTAEPPFKVFDDYLTLQENDQLFIEGKYNNTSDKLVTFGLTTKDEMFGIFVNYLVGDISQLSSATPVAVTNNTKQQNWSVNPNPAKAQIQINLPHTNKQVFQVKLYNATGQLLHQTTTTKASNQHHINISNYTAGIYMLQIQNNQITSTKKLIIKR